MRAAPLISRKLDENRLMLQQQASLARHEMAEQTLKLELKIDQSTRTMREVNMVNQGILKWSEYYVMHLQDEP